MIFNPDIHHRRSIRLKGYDYSSAGAYFVTVCTWNRECLFGEISDGEIQLNEEGRIVEHCWLDIPNHFPHVALDTFVVMPNHVHGIIVITEMVGAKNFSPLHVTHSALRPPSKTIGSIIRGFKIGVTKWFRGNTNIYTVWQRNYYEHIIRDENEMNRFREYIVNNPLKWAMDENNPANIK